jgi:hypothetical protein
MYFSSDLFVFFNRRLDCVYFYFLYFLASVVQFINIRCVLFMDDNLFTLFNSFLHYVELETNYCPKVMIFLHHMLLPFLLSALLFPSHHMLFT